MAKIENNEYNESRRVVKMLMIHMRCNGEGGKYREGEGEADTCDHGLSKMLSAVTGPGN